MENLEWVPDTAWKGWVDLKKGGFTVCSYKPYTTFRGEKYWMFANGLLKLGVQKIDYMPEEELRTYLETLYKMQGET